MAFVNDFSPAEYRRMYTVTNHEPRFVRAWHGHKSERKAASVMSGAALICAVAIDDWEDPSKDLEVHRYVLSESNPGVLVIPAGYANGFMSLTAETRITFFSSATLDESLRDDIRSHRVTGIPGRSRSAGCSSCPLSSRHATRSPAAKVLEELNRS